MKKQKDIYIELEVESIGFQGIAVARKDGIVYFVKNGLPGDTVLAKVKRKKKNYFETTLSEIIKPSEYRISAPCSYFEFCGGCSWQELVYSEQLKWKKQHVRDAFERIAKIEVGTIDDTLASPKEFEYRNKMEFSFSAHRWFSIEEISSEEEIIQKNFALGLHAPGRYDKVIDMNECLIQQKTANKVLEILRDKALTLGISAYDTHNQSGYLRNVIIRTTEFNQELMVVLVTNDLKSDEEKIFLDWYYEEFCDLLPEVSVLAHSLNNTLSPVATDDLTIIKGTGFITENILGINYRISPFSFFQTNSSQLNQFIGEIIKIADLNKEDIVWDLYCGTGSISLPASKSCSGVIGIEIFAGSIADAKVNAQLNNITNCEFICADIHSKDNANMFKSLPNPDVVILDPPRAGLHTNLIESLIRIKPRKIVYVSCNPTTQARDCELLSEFYKVKQIRPVDMFPHTFHVESIAELVLT